MYDENEEVKEVKEPEVVVKKRKKLPVVVAALIGILSGVALTLGFLVIVGVTRVEKPVVDTKLALIEEIIKNYYYKDVDDKTLQEGIYSGVVESIGDPYAQYYTKDQYSDALEVIKGEYAGIGAILSKNAKTGEVKITKVYKDTPAEKSGLKAEDEIISANGFIATEYDLDAFVSDCVRGEAGTTVHLVILRDGEMLEIDCERDNIETPTVEYQMLEDNIGYISVSRFSNTTGKDFIEAYDDLEDQGMTRVIVDLRSNGGGVVDAVEEMLDYLLPEGTVVYTMDKNGNRKDTVSKAESHKDLPMAVLVDGNTASASEIFTGAVRDFDYATIIGTQTYGKGIVQSTIPLGDGSAIKLTTHTYYTPSGECIHEKGIKPDIELEFDYQGDPKEGYKMEFDNQLQKAIEILK